MKSRISYFDATIFRKNLTRFAPAWGLFTVWLLLAVFTNCSINFVQAGSNLLDLAQFHCSYAFFFAPLCAQLLFGDLFNARMCNALHALPLRRETWFGTNVISGFTLHLIPAVSATVLAGLLLGLGGYEGNMAVVPLFLLTIILQYLFFFGIAVFSIFFAGSRFAHVVVYLLLNFGALLLQWLVSSLYTPMFYGVRTNPEPFQLFAPIAKLTEAPFLEVEMTSIINNMEYRMPVDTKNILRGDGFGYYFVAAAAGVLLLLGALWLYRRRKLECAGDFLAIRGLCPVFALIFTLMVGTFFQEISAGILLLPGLVIGWFTSLMLLERTGRVFKKKNFLRGGALIGIFLLTLAISAWDPLGIEEWVPEAEKVESVSIYEGHYSYTGKKEILLLEEQEDVETVIGIHRDCLERWLNHTDSYYRIGNDIVFTVGNEDSIPLTISYQLKNGRIVSRYYYIRGEENYQQLNRWLSQPEAVLGELVTEAEFLAQNEYVKVRLPNSSGSRTIFGQENMASLHQAIVADCEAETMAQELNYYIGEDICYILEFSNGLRLYVYENSLNTYHWIRSHIT